MERTRRLLLAALRVWELNGAGWNNRLPLRALTDGARRCARMRRSVRLSSLPNFAPDVYMVTWSALAWDLQVSKGAFSFEVAPK